MQSFWLRPGDQWQLCWGVNIDPCKPLPDWIKIMLSVTIWHKSSLTNQHKASRNLHHNYTSLPGTAVFHSANDEAVWLKVAKWRQMWPVMNEVNSDMWKSVMRCALSCTWPKLSCKMVKLKKSMGLLKIPRVTCNLWQWWILYHIQLIMARATCIFRKCSWHFTDKYSSCKSCLSRLFSGKRSDCIIIGKRPLLLVACLFPVV